MPQLPDHAIRDTVAAVFRQPRYERSARTLLDRFLEWLLDLFRRLGHAVGGSTVLQRVALGVLVLLVVTVAARMLFLAHAGRVARAARPGGATARFGGGTSMDPWSAAQALAARGDFTEAAHALYAAILDAVARRERIRLHPSKTVGDYARELRRRSSGLFPRYRDFARSYEVVVYGIGRCDRERYDRLRALATEIVANG
jgi:hypothetical protein